MARLDESDITARGSIRTAQPVEIADPLDIFIAGGGPAGTAAAFRATELGLSCLVVDYDDLLSRIRDYPVEKALYQDFDGDSTPFPSGDRLIASLHFQSINKDVMARNWRAIYREANIPAKIGCEFTGLQRRDDGLWDVKTWNHRVQQETIYRARYVVVAIGAGRPRRFQVPGNLDGIAFRLDDAKKYVGGPILVIGGGTSAAEAVICISSAKVAANDRSPVYWSYRKDQMPRVEKSLSGPFFDAYFTNGNVRYLPFSEPILVLTAPDKKEYLSVRIDRKEIEGRPAESLHLEFPKDRVVACIGADVPHVALQKLGIRVPTIESEPYILVTEDGECSLPDVFVIGDVKGTPEYYRCENFDDPATYKKRRDKRNIKMGMRDAVRAVEVIAVRAGKLARAAETPVVKSASGASVKSVVSVITEGSGAPAEDRLVSLLPDGSVEAAYPLKIDVTRIGRKTDAICFDDVHMEDHHASVSKKGEQYVISDSGTGSGIWLRVRGAGRELSVNDQVWLGAQFLRVTTLSGRWGVEHFDSKAEYRETYWSDEKGVVLGRAADITLDAKDWSLSRGHARFTVENGKLRVADIGSTNGTFVKLTGPATLVNGDEFRIATRRMRFESFETEEPLPAGTLVLDRPTEPALAPATGGGPEAARGPIASFEDARHPVAFGVSPERDVLHAFFDYLKSKYPDMETRKCGVDKSRRCPDDHFKEPLDWSCEAGSCGYCAIQVVAGADQLVPSDNPELEKSTLASIRRVTPDLGKYRLACLLRIQGPVTLKVLPKS